MSIDIRRIDKANLVTAVFGHWPIFSGARLEHVTPSDPSRGNAVTVTVDAPVPPQHSQSPVAKRVKIRLSFTDVRLSAPFEGLDPEAELLCLHIYELAEDSTRLGVDFEGGPLFVMECSEIAVESCEEYAAERSAQPDLRSR